jgi:signal transduction histidine kinase
VSRRMPRRTVRLRFTLLYGALFLASGAVLLAITYALVASRIPLLVLEHMGANGTPVPGAGGGNGGLGQVPDQLDQIRASLQAQAEQQRANALHELLVMSGFALAIMAVISLGLGWLAAGRVLRPLRTITAAARHISASNLHLRLALDGPDDEVKELGDTFDGLLTRLEAAFDAQRRFVANASHELRTPLARQQTMVEVALADPQPSAASLLDVCRRVLAAGQQQERLIEALLTLARSQRGLDRREPVDLAAVAGDVVRSRRAEAASRGVGVDVTLGPADTLGDTRLVERLAANLLDNALRHNVPGGNVAVRTETRAGDVVLSVTNTGPVVPPGQLGRLFEPFQRLATGRTSSRDGTGLGLSIVAAVAKAHDAPLRARAPARGGLEVDVFFPPQPRDAPGAEHADRATPVVSASRHMP